jgi:hypothetical protein
MYFPTCTGASKAVLCLLLALSGCTESAPEDPDATPLSATDAGVAESLDLGPETAPDAQTLADSGPMIQLPRFEPAHVTTERLAAFTPIGPHGGALVADVGDGTAWLFGGIDANTQSGTVLGDLWHLDATGDAPSFTRIEAMNAGPDPRYCGCAGWDPMTKRLLVAGGRGRSQTDLYAETWAYDPAENSWTQQPLPRPAAAVGCAMAYSHVEGTFFMFGGANESGTQASTWIYDRQWQRWDRLDLEDAPRARYDAELVELASGDLALVGGAARMNGPFYPEVWVLDPTAQTWRELAAEPGPEGRREPWVVATAEPAGLVYGFGATAAPLGDLWFLDLTTQSWRELTLEDGPSARGFTQRLPGPEGSLGLLLGGFVLSGPLADLWGIQ